MSAWLERTVADDWTLNPDVWNYQIAFRPSQYVLGFLAESWEMPNASTYILHLNQDIYWQNIPPANGRQFVASDVVFHYDRLLGIGDGFTVPNAVINITAYQQLASVTATDNFTVVFTWKIANPVFITETVQAGTSSSGCIENPEAVQQWGNLQNWHNAIGTGPFILTDFVDGISATLEKNPNYWGYDQRYPQNKLPYINTFNILVIPNDVTALAAMRAGKIDLMDRLSVTESEQMKQSNPEIVQYPVVLTQGTSIDPRNDVVPYKDIRVREALQLAIDLPTIAKTYYDGFTSPDPCSLTSNYETGYNFPYDQWPADLQAQYTYNPTEARQLLAAAGYPNGFNTDIVADNTVDTTLLQIVQSYFAAIGVQMSIKLMDPASANSFIQVSHAQDALAQRPSGGLGYTYEPIRQLQKYLTGNGSNWINVNDPTFNAFYTEAMAATSIEGVQQVMQQANEYMAQQHFVISLLQPMTWAISQPWVFGFSGQFGSLAGTSSGYSYLFFYEARFWINKNVK